MTKPAANLAIRRATRESRPPSVNSASLVEHRLVVIASCMVSSILWTAVLITSRCAE